MKYQLDIVLTFSQNQDEIDFINSKTDEYAKTHNISKEQATKILYTAAKTLVDENANTNFNSNENFIATDELGNSVTYNLNEIANGYNKDDISKAKEFLKSNSNNLKFTDIYKEEFNKQTFFTATKEQYENSNWTPDRSIGLGIDIPSLLPTAGVAKLGVNALKTTATEVKTVLNTIEANTMAKVTQNLPKNGVYNQETKLININGKDYGLAGFDITGQPVFGQIKNNKWAGNFRIFTNGENIQVTKPIVSTNGNSSLIKDIQTEFYKNPYLYTTLIVGGIGSLNDAFNPSMPPETYFGKMYYIYDNWDKLENNIKIFFNKE